MPCATCVYFADHSQPDDEPDEPNGYCCHPDHSLPNAEHHAYGGHWTHSDSGCDKWAVAACAPAVTASRSSLPKARKPGKASNDPDAALKVEA